MHPNDDDGCPDPRENGLTRRIGWRACWWVLGATVLLGLLATQRRPLTRWARGEVDLEGRRLYTPAHAPDPAAVAGLDLERVHRELLPRWVLEASRRQRGRATTETEAEAFDALAGALEPDRNLLDLAKALRRVVGEDLQSDPERALYLTWAWSRYLDTMRQPWVVHGRVRATRHGPVFALMIYEIVDEAVISVGVHDQRVRAVRRIDGINLREAYLGATTRDDPTAIVSMDRLEELATRELWPLLGPSGGSTAGRRSAFADAVASEIRAAVGHEHFRTLARTAWARSLILETIDQIHARHACGSTFRIHAIPDAGFDTQRIERLRRFAAASHGRCPSITTIEVERIAEASSALEDASARLEPALTTLTLWAADLVGVHEARHLADAEAGADFDRGPACPGCPARLSAETRNELSGYLAALAWSGAPVTTLFQACRATALDPGGPHVEAMNVIEPGLGVRCSTPPPPDLTARARALERTLLGRSDPIAVARTFALPAH
jgi:hypothetical protein